MNAAQIAHALIATSFLIAGTTLLIVGHVLAGPLCIGASAAGWLLLIWMMVSDATTKPVP